MLELAQKIPNPLSSTCSTPPTLSAMDVAKNKNVTTRKSLPSVTPKSKKKAWSKESKPCNTGEIDREFLNTMNSIQKAMVEPTTVHKSSGSDDDEHFCLSLVGPLKSLEPRYKSVAKLQIMKVFNDIEWQKDSHQQAQHNQLSSGQGWKKYRTTGPLVPENILAPRKKKIKPKNVQCRKKELMIRKY